MGIVAVVGGGRRRVWVHGHQLRLAILLRVVLLLLHLGMLLSLLLVLGALNEHTQLLCVRHNKGEAQSSEDKKQASRAPSHVRTHTNDMQGGHTRGITVQAHHTIDHTAQI